MIYILIIIIHVHFFLGLTITIIIGVIICVHAKLCLYFVDWVIVWRVYIKGTTRIHAFIIIYRRQRVCVMCKLFVGRGGGKLIMIPVFTM